MAAPKPTMHFDADEAPPTGLIERWMEESYRTLAPKTLVRQLDEDRGAITD